MTSVHIFIVPHFTSERRRSQTYFRKMDVDNATRNHQELVRLFCIVIIVLIQIEEDRKAAERQQSEAVARRERRVRRARRARHAERREIRQRRGERSEANRETRRRTLWTREWLAWRGGF